MKRLVLPAGFLLVAGCGAPAGPGMQPPEPPPAPACTLPVPTPEHTVHGAVTAVSERPDGAPASAVPDAPMPSEIDLGRVPVGEPNAGSPACLPESADGTALPPLTTTTTVPGDVASTMPPDVGSTSPGGTGDPDAMRALEALCTVPVTLEAGSWCSPGGSDTLPPLVAP